MISGGRRAVAHSMFGGQGFQEAWFFRKRAEPGAISGGEFCQFGLVLVGDGDHLILERQFFPLKPLFLFLIRRRQIRAVPVFFQFFSQLLVPCVEQFDVIVFAL